MQKKINIAFIKYGGLAAGGTEKWLQQMALNLPKDIFEIDYYYCDPSDYLGSNYIHAPTDHKIYINMIDKNINLIKFKVGFKDVRHPFHIWKYSNFWKIFNHQKYDFVQTAKAGHKEYPYYKIPLPIVEYVTLDTGVDKSKNIFHSIHLSNWQRDQWVSKGGDFNKSSVLPIPGIDQLSNINLREELGIKKNDIVLGFHQRQDDNIYSPIPLNVFKNLNDKNTHFILMGGSELYKNFAKKKNLDNIHFLKHDSNPLRISSFLNTLDIYCHGRSDGETFGTVLAEAMLHKLPCVSHVSTIANGHIETIGEGGKVCKSETDYLNFVKKLINDNSFRIEISNKALKRSSNNYNITSIVQKLSYFYQQNQYILRKFKEEMPYFSYSFSDLKMNAKFLIRKIL